MYGYTDEAIRACGLDPEDPDQPRPPITVDNVNSVMGRESKKKMKAKDSHIGFGLALNVAWC